MPHAYSPLGSSLLGETPEDDVTLSELRTAGEGGRPATVPTREDLGLGRRVGRFIEGVGEFLQDLPAARRGQELPSERRTKQSIERAESLLTTLMKSGAPTSVLEPVLDSLDRALRAADPTMGLSPEAKQHIANFPQRASALFDEEFLRSLAPAQRQEFNRLALTEPKRAQEIETKYRMGQATKEATRLASEKGIGFDEALRQTVRSNPSFVSLREAFEIKAAPELGAEKTREFSDTSAAARHVQETLIEGGQADVDTLIAEVAQLYPAADLKQVMPLLLERAKEQQKLPSNEMALAFLAAGPAGDPKTKQAIAAIKVLPRASQQVTASTLAYVAAGEKGPEQERASRALALIRGVRAGDIVRARTTARRLAEDAVPKFEADRDRKVRQRTGEILSDILEGMVPEGEEGEAPLAAPAPPATRQTFEALPDPAKFKGKTFTDTVTGERWKSDGKKWDPVKGGR